MNHNSRLTLKYTGLALLLSALTASLSIAFGQGTLTPPGPPGPMMKSLDQIEARTPISSAPFTITNRGSYYLTTNLLVTSGNAIVIAASGVTLDLNGFTISSSNGNADPSDTGVLLNNSSAVAGQVGLHDIAIVNGVIESSFTNNSGVWMGAGFNSGINYSGSVAPFNVRVREVSVSGCFNYGILVGLSGSVVESCMVQSVGTYGIYANTICRSTVLFCGNHGIVGSTVSDCYGSSFGSGGGDGIYCVTANNSTGNSQSGEGMLVQNSATGCFGQSGTSIGLECDGTANGCYGVSVSNSGGGDGLIASIADNCFGEADGNGEGLYASGMAHNCSGQAHGPGAGLNTTSANNCYGSSGTGYGLYASIAIGCWGASSTGTSLNSFIANSSYGNTGSETVTYKYNMP